MVLIAGHTKPPDSSPEAPESPREKDSPEPPSIESRDLKSPRQDPYLHNSMPENLPPMPTAHDIPPPMYGTEDGRILQQPFSFPPMLMSSQMDNAEVTPTDLRVMSKNSCPCATSVQDMDEPQNLAYRRREKESSESDSDTEIDLTSHSSKDDDLRESERLASRIATSIFRSDTVLHDLVPNDLSLGSVKNVGGERIVNRSNMTM